MTLEKKRQCEKGTALCEKITAKKQIRYFLGVTSSKKCGFLVVVEGHFTPFWSVPFINMHMDLVDASPIVIT